MQTVTRNTICPVCKCALATGQTDPSHSTRLCDSCKAMIAAILPRNDFVAVPGAAPQPQYATILEAPSEHRAGFQAPQILPANKRESLPESNLNLIDTTEIEIGYLDYTESPLEADSSNPDDPLRQEAEQFPFSSGTLSVDDDFQQTGRDLSPTAASNMLASEPEILCVRDDAEQAGTKEADPEAVDPWDDPLPTWEYSHHEWRLVGGKKRRRKHRGLKRHAALAGIVVSVCAIAVIIISRPFSSSGGEATNKASMAAALNSTPSPNIANPAEHTPPAAEPAAQQSLAPASHTDSQPNQKGDATAVGQALNEGQGRHSLQAASFPDESAANELADKLRRVGVSAYVVSADLARKGRWFRVRIGRFNTPGDAQRYAAQSKVRSKAAGINLNLIVCDYERP